MTPGMAVDQALWAAVAEFLGLEGTGETDGLNGLAAVVDAMEPENPLGASYLRRLQALVADPESLEAQLRAVQFGHGAKASEYEIGRTEACSGLIDSVENHRNASEDLIELVTQELADGELKVGQQYPGFAMWQIQEANPGNKKKPILNKLLQADVLAVFHRVVSQYLSEMRALAQGGQGHRCDLYHEADRYGVKHSRCMAHTFVYIGSLKENWPMGSVVGKYQQGMQTLFYGDWDGFSRNKICPFQLPPLGSNAVNACIQALVEVGIPKALRAIGWDQDLVDQAMPYCGVFPSNPTADPDSYPGTHPLSFHLQFLWQGPYVTGNPKFFDQFAQTLVMELAKELLAVDLAGGRAGGRSMDLADDPTGPTTPPGLAFGLACAAACTDPNVYRARGAYKAKGCCKVPTGTTKPRWQHLQPSRFSGAKVRAMAERAFGEGMGALRDDRAGFDPTRIATAMSLFTLPNLISTEWARHKMPKDVPHPVQASATTEIRQRTTAILLVLKQLVERVCLDAAGRSSDQPDASTQPAQPDPLLDPPPLVLTAEERTNLTRAIAGQPVLTIEAMKINRAPKRMNRAPPKAPRPAKGPDSSGLAGPTHPPDRVSLKRKFIESIARTNFSNPSNGSKRSNPSTKKAHPTKLTQLNQQTPLAHMDPDTLIYDDLSVGEFLAQRARAKAAFQKQCDVQAALDRWLGE